MQSWECLRRASLRVAHSRCVDGGLVVASALANNIKRLWCQQTTWLCCDWLLVCAAARLTILVPACCRTKPMFSFHPLPADRRWEQVQRAGQNKRALWAPAALHRPA